MKRWVKKSRHNGNKKKTMKKHKEQIVNAISRLKDGIKQSVDILKYAIEDHIGTLNAHDKES